MSVPETLPASIANAGRFIAHLRLEVTNNQTITSHLFFLVVDSNRLYRIFHATRNRDSGELKVWSQNVETHCHDVVNRIWNIRYPVPVVDGEIWNDTFEGRDFANRFLSDNPELKNIVRVRHGTSDPE